jgi:hypothetical protein
VLPFCRAGIVRVFAAASRALRDAARLPSAALDPTTATLGLAAIGPAGGLGGQRPRGLFPVALTVAQAMIKLADEPSHCAASQQSGLQTSSNPPGSAPLSNVWMQRLTADLFSSIDMTLPIYWQGTPCTDGTQHSSSLAQRPADSGVVPAVSTFPMRSAKACAVAKTASKVQLITASISSNRPICARFPSIELEAPSSAFLPHPECFRT